MVLDLLWWIIRNVPLVAEQDMKKTPLMLEIILRESIVMPEPNLIYVSVRKMGPAA